MQISEQGLALIRRYEGFSSQPYRCPAGKLTIGYGHVIGADESYGEIDEAQAAALLQQDVDQTEQGVSRSVTVPLTQGQFDALVSFTYNVGVDAFHHSSLLRLLNAGSDAAAAQEFNRWVYASGQKLEGLVQRRAAETALFIV